MRNGVLERVDNVKRGRGRPKLTWDESVKRDLKDWNISKEIALDRSAWRLAINIAWEKRLLLLLLFPEVATFQCYRTNFPYLQRPMHHMQSKCISVGL